MTKLAIWRTLRAAYGFTFTPWSRVVTTAKLWLAALGVLALILPWLTPESPMLGGALGLAALLLGAAGGLAFTVAWYRAVLAEDAPLLRFGRRELRFLGYALLVAVIGAALTVAAFILVLPVAFLAPSLPKGYIIVLAAKLAAYAALGTVLARLALVFPALALDGRGDMLEQAWQRSRGNGLRLFAGLVLAGLPFALAHHLVAALLGAPGWVGHHVYGVTTLALLGQSLMGALDMVGAFFALAVTAAFLALAYRALAAGAEADGGRMRGTALPAF